MHALPVAVESMRVDSAKTALSFFQNQAIFMMTAKGPKNVTRHPTKALGRM